MLSIDIFTLCDFALTSKEGKLSLIGLFDRVFVHQLPAQHSRFFVVAVLTGEPGQPHRVSLALTSPSQKDVLPSRELDINLGASGKSNLLTDLTNLKLAEFGPYLFQLKSKDQTIAQTNLLVTKVKEAAPSTPPN